MNETVETKWITFTRRTDDPKLAYLEYRLTAAKIPHRRSGYSFHAPILQIPEKHYDGAWAILSERVEAVDDLEQTVSLDDIPDDDILFQGHEPHDWLGDERKT